MAGQWQLCSKIVFPTNFASSKFSHYGRTYGPMELRTQPLIESLSKRLKRELLFANTAENETPRPPRMTINWFQKYESDNVQEQLHPAVTNSVSINNGSKSNGNPHLPKKLHSFQEVLFLITVLTKTTRPNTRLKIRLCIFYNNRCLKKK